MLSCCLYPGSVVCVMAAASILGVNSVDTVVKMMIFRLTSFAVCARATSPAHWHCITDQEKAHLLVRVRQRQGTPVRKGTLLVSLSHKSYFLWARHWTPTGISQDANRHFNFWCQSAICRITGKVQERIFHFGTVIFAQNTAFPVSQIIR